METEMNFVIPAPPRQVLEVAGNNATFPVRRIYCVGRNYIEHIRETGNDEREPPFFFQKPADALVPSGGEFPYPPLSTNVHHEIELVAAISEGGRNIPADKALDHVYGYAVGIDMTRRDLQGEAKEMRRPWEPGKAFDHAAPCTPIVPASEIGHPDKARIWLKVNGEIRQDANIDDMIWNLPETIAHLSQSYELQPGDLILTGTPAGVGPVERGDVVTGGVEGVGELEIHVT
jgi:fumarylpyruvate hydrolase